MSIRMALHNQIVDRTTASIGIPDTMASTASPASRIALLRRWSVTIGRWTGHHEHDRAHS